MMVIITHEANSGCGGSRLWRGLLNLVGPTCVASNTTAAYYDVHISLAV